MRLIDCFTELVIYTHYFSKSIAQKQPPFEQVRADIHRLLAKSEECTKKDEQLSSEDYDSARFAICAWVDEIILKSSWKEKDKWGREQLQRLYYNTARAGEKFFERLNSLDFDKKDVREVYYLCLAMGFMGRYCNKGEEYLLEQLKTSNLKLLIDPLEGMASIDKIILFPDSYASKEININFKKKRFILSPSLITFFALGAPVFIFFVLFFIYSFILSNKAENILF